MRRPSILLVAVLFVAAGAAPAHAQWAWRDANNQLVLSDRPPPASIKAERIVRQPGANAPLAVATPVAPVATPANDTQKPAAGPKSLAERELDFRKRLQERETADKKLAEAAARSSQLAQECQRSRGYLRSLEDGVRVVRDDAQGNRQFLDDEQRRDEIQRLKESIARSCS